MKKILLALVVPVLLLCGLSCRQSTQPGGTSNAPAVPGGADTAASQQKTAPRTHLKVGDAAPDFTLTDTGGSPVSLSDFRGKKNVALAFYVLAFTGG